MTRCSVLTRHTALVLFPAALLGLLAAAAQTDEWTRLQQRFQARDAQIQQLKAARVVGETSSGYLDFPDPATGATAPTPEGRRLLEEENADRRRLYALIGERESVPPDVVADRAARRNFARARSGELLRYPDGIWRQKP